MTFLGNAIPSDYPDFQEFGDTPCSQADPEAFFPIDYDASKKPGRGYYLYEREAKLVCFECPYKLRCLEYALRHPEELGIWGGTTEYDRKKMRSGKLGSLRLPPSKRR
jgi:WhiB family redox-sensing transcriptional regulator